MQKISSYLYSNAIQVNLDLDLLPTEWRIVYQRTVKIYKGYDNIIELDIKNAQQRRFDVSDKTLKCLVMDALGKEVTTADITHGSTPGLATFSISADSVEYLTPQFLNYTIYVLNDDDTKNIIYGDTQFGATGRMELIGTSAVRTAAPEVIKTFTYLEDTTQEIRTYYSESVIVNPKNDIATTAPVDLDFVISNLEAEVNVQITYDKVISSETTWETVETFSVTTSTSSLTKSYEIPTDFTDEVNWLRVTYIRADNNTGKIDRVTVTQ